MNNLTNAQQLYYLTHKKDTLTTVLLAIFLTPFTLLYTRGFLVMLVSWIVLIVAVFTPIVTEVLLNADVVGNTTILSLIVSLAYFIFAITDAGRVNDKLLAELLTQNIVDTSSSPRKS